MKTNILLLVSALSFNALSSSCSYEAKGECQVGGQFLFFEYSIDSVLSGYVVEFAYNKGDYRHESWYLTNLRGVLKDKRKGCVRVQKDTLFLCCSYHKDTLNKVFMVRDTFSHHFSGFIKDENGDTLPSEESFWQLDSRFIGKRQIVFNERVIDAYRFDASDDCIDGDSDTIDYDSLFNVLSFKRLCHYDYTEYMLKRLDTMPDAVRHLVDSLDKE